MSSLDSAIEKLRANDPGLTELDISNHHIGAEGGGKLADALTKNTTLTQLDIHWNHIGAEGSGKLADALTKNTTLTELDISGNRIGDEGGAKLADALTKNTTLTQLDMRFNDIGAKGGVKLADALTKNTTLTQLDISYNDIGAKGAEKLADALTKNTTLTQLDICGNRLGDEGAEKLADALTKNTTLTQLDISGNRIGDKGAGKLADALTKNATLTQLDLSENDMGAEGGVKLADALTKNTTLTQLDLSYNRIGAEGSGKLADALTKNATLTQLDIGFNGIGNPKAAAAKFGQALSNRPRPPGGSFVLEGVLLRAAAVELGLPPEARNWDNAKILAHFWDLQSHGQLVRRVKLIVVGHGEGGKTTLVRRLRTGTFAERPGTTDGIEMVEWKERDLGPEITFSLLDCGGQDVYQRTHPFFFTSRSVFLVIWNPRHRQKMHAAVDEFVQTVQTRAPDAKVAFVSTHADEGIAPHGVSEALASFGMQGAKHFHVSCKDGSGIKDLTKHLRELALSLPHVEQRVPQSYIDLERVLKGLDCTAGGAVPIDDIFVSCMIGPQPIDVDEDTVRRALPFLRDWGSVLFFEHAPVLRDWVFVSPKKIAALMSDLISFDTSKPGTCRLRNGILEHSDLTTVFPDGQGYTQGSREALLALLHVCEVVLPLPGGSSSLVPAMLDSTPPDSRRTWLDEPGWRKAKMQLKLKPLLPADLLPRLVVRLRNLYARGCWEDGALLEKQGASDSSRAVVHQNRRERQLDIECGGTYPEDVRGQIFHVLERLLEEGYHGVCVEALVSCPRPECQKWACPSSMLNKCLERNRSSLTCQSCVEDISIQDLSAGIFSKDQAERAFGLRLSSAGGGAAERESLRRDFMRLMHMRVKDTEAWRYGRSDVPCLWLPVARDKTHPDRWVLRPVCEHLGCWHAIDGMSTTTDSVAHSYFAMVAPALEKLMDDCRFEAGARVICTSHREALDPDRQELELASIGALVKGFYDSSASCGKRGRGEGGSAAAQRGRPKSVSVPESPTVWMCEEHAEQITKPGYDTAALLEKISNELWRWEWKDTSEGIYKSYASKESLQIEEAFKAFRGGGEHTCEIQVEVHVLEATSARKRARIATIDFKQMTVSHDGGWTSLVRRWDVRIPQAESWEHQDVNVRVVPITCESNPVDYALVESSFFKNRDDGATPLISRDTHSLVQVRRIQNRGLLRDWLAQKDKIADLRGAGNVNDVLAWHGSGKLDPMKIAQAKDGFLNQYSAATGFYNQGTYCAEHPSYSHDGKYVYRSSDKEGRHGDESGEYFHLILCKVILGNSWRLEDILPQHLRSDPRNNDNEVARRQKFAKLERQLQEKECDSVTGGPHRPGSSGRGENDSIMYVDYSGKQVLPEFIVTYKEGRGLEGPSAGMKRGRG